MPGADDSGFSLMELLVAIGIMAAIAAITVPLVSRFASSGESGAMTSEKESIQTAIDTYIAENTISALPSGDFNDPGGSVTNSFSGGAGTLDLSAALRKATSTFYYCWDSTGKVTKNQKGSSGSC